MKLSGLGRNAVWNIAEVLFASLVLFILYRLILTKLGVPALGVWSLVLATTSLTRFADVGAASGLGRYVALSAAKGGKAEDALIYVETAFITNLVLYAAISLLLYLPISWGVGLTTHGDARAMALELVPLAVGSLALQNLAGVMVSALTGYHRSYLKSALMIAAQAAQVVVGFLTIDALGLRGVALAQIVQFGIMTFFGWFLVVRVARGHWSWSVPHRLGLGPLKDLLGFGMRLQALSLVSFPYEPLTKMAISAVGGVGALGMFELASRTILQVRQVVVAPSQNLTPLFAAAELKGPAALRDLYERSAIFLFLGAGAAMLAVAIGAPVISWIWLQRVDPLFVGITIILAAGWFVNIAGTPGFYLGVATGRLRWNILGGLGATVASPLLCLALGPIFGLQGQAGGAMLAISAGTALTWVLNTGALGLPILPPWIHWRRVIEDSLGRFRGP